jgi:hypothetical protein
MAQKIDTMVGIKGRNSGSNLWIPISVDANGNLAGSASILNALQETYPATTDDTDAPAANTAAVITLAAQAGLSNVIGEVYWSYDDTPTGGELTIEDGAGTTVFQQHITNGGPGFFQFLYPKRGTANTAMIVTLAAGGAGISGTLNITAWTV